MVKILSEDEFKAQVVLKYTDVIGEKLGGSVLACSDEWFAEAENLIKPKAPIRDATRFVHAGAWYDGWETRRHNTEEADWVVIKAGVALAQIAGCEVDTAFFNGNHAPHISVEGANFAETSGKSAPTDWATANVNWEPLIEKTECGPSQKHFFVRENGLLAQNYTHFRLRMYPDGGIARFRLYGVVLPVLPQDSCEVLDFALVKNGGVAVKVSDQHFGSADNLLLPGRGHDMSDGWETKRLRTPGHVDWVVVKLGAPTTIKNIVVDTAHFRGNFPQKVNLKGYYGEAPPAFDSDEWKLLVDDSKTGPDAEHKFDVSETLPFTHVLLTIIPDGGVKRIRVNGCIAK